ncbi:MAG: V-type ATP synthase subunit E [Trueperaceae bacterium]|nr:V-type ATP synthase subunit E [Trueperaceae bacterium]
MAELSALLAKEASAEIEGIESEARQRASELLAAARSEADALLAARERVVKAQREAGLVRAKSAAQLEASAVKLRAQHEAVEGVFDGAKAKLEELVSDASRYAPVLGKLLAEALASLGSQQIDAVEVAKSELELAKAAVAQAGLDVKVEASDAVKGGVRLRTKGHSVVENSLYGRLDALKGELAAEVSKALFGAGAS